MELKDVIEILQAAKRGEKIETRNSYGEWMEVMEPRACDFAHYDYRIAPKKEMTLVDELRTYADQVGRHGDLFISAADRITELEEILHHNLDRIDNDLLMTLLKKRLRK